jgi:hypothetical protein
MNGFGFIEYKDAMDARDVVPGMAALFLSGAIHNNKSFSQPSTAPTSWASA